MARDVKYALRNLAKAPAFSFTALFLVALGVGAVTTIFTLVDDVLLRPLPYPGQERLLLVEGGSHPGPLYQQLREMELFEAIAAADSRDVTLTSEVQPLRLRLATVSEGFFAMYGATPVLGRLLTSNDGGAASTVVVGGEAWERVWGSDPSIVGRTIDVGGEPLTVVGVVDPAFVAPQEHVGPPPDLWRGLDWESEDPQSHGAFALQVVGRLRPGVGAPAAAAELATVMEAMSGVHENYRAQDGTPRDLPLTQLSEVTVREVKGPLGALFGAVVLLLLVACANVAHLFLARGLARQREMAVRRALGAGTGRLFSQLLIEAVTLGTLGGLIGTGLAWAGVSGFMSLYPETFPRSLEVAMDLRVLGFGLMLSIATALAFGLIPTLRAVRSDPADELRGSGRAVSAGPGVVRLRNLLVVAEVAVSLVLVASSGLLVRSFLLVRYQDPGLDTENVWTVPLQVSETDTPEAYREMLDAIRGAVLQVPGVVDAAYGLTLPHEGSGPCCWRSSASLDGVEIPTPFMHPVSQGYFSTLGVELIAGRVWGTGETLAEPWPVVLTEPMAREIFATPDAAIGQVIQVSTQGGSLLEVVGVSEDTKHFGLDRSPDPTLYLPIERLHFPEDRAHVAVKLAGPEAVLPMALREAIWSVAPGLPVPEVRRMSDWIGESTSLRRFRSAVFLAFAVIALLLAAGGVYGTLLFTANQRRREMGIRLALGASRGNVERQFIRSGVAVGAVGVVLGLAGSRVAGRMLEGQLWGVDAVDPVTLTGSSALLVLTVVVASWLPARGAGRVSPRETLLE